MPKRFQFTAIVSGEITIPDTVINAPERVQDIMNGFIRESISQSADEVVIDTVQSSFTKKEPNALESLLEQHPIRQSPDTETPDVSDINRSRR